MDGQVAYKESHVDETTHENYQANRVMPSKPSLSARVKKFFLDWFRLSNAPAVKVYHAYGHARKVHVFGHVLALNPFPRKKYRRNIWTNTFALLRSFMVRPIPFAFVRLNWKGQWIYSQAEADGFFKFDLEPNEALATGWKEVIVEYLGNLKAGDPVAKGTGLIYLPPANRFGCISDIDDTFLISHSSHLLKRIYVLLTRNAHSRKPFEGVVRHYQLLAEAGSTPDKPNPFFYVSSSEWNLYDFIVEFARKNEMPAGIYLLNQLKRFKQLLQTGQGKHSGKFTRIIRILEAFPNMQFILMGDSSQRDPYIYASIVEHFPKQVYAVYIRDVYKKNTVRAKEIMRRIESAGIPCCFFAHSSDAILHSQKIGLIPTPVGD
jgi:phosphatidate phosphatase APP1